MYIAPVRTFSYVIGNQTLALFDIIGLVIALILAMMWTNQFLKDRKVLSKLDPIKKPTDSSK